MKHWVFFKSDLINVRYIACDRIDLSLSFMADRTQRPSSCSHGGQRCSERDCRDGNEGKSNPIASLGEIAVRMSGKQRLMKYLPVGRIATFLALAFAEGKEETQSSVDVGTRERRA